MKTTANGQVKKGTRNIMVAAALLAAGLLAFPTVAMAERGRAHDQRGRQTSRSHDRGRHDHGRVPQRMHKNYRHDYKRYYRGRSYYGPHRHYHYSYRFPVYIGGRLVYRTYPYCGGNIFLSGSFFLPRLGFGVRIGPAFPPYPPPYVY